MSPALIPAQNPPYRQETDTTGEDRAMATPQQEPQTLRTPEEIREQIRERTEDPYYRRSNPGYWSGVMASLTWAAGDTAVAPVSGQTTGLPDERVANREYQAAIDAYYAVPVEGRARRERYGLAYVTGAENALAWITGGDGL